MNTLHGTTHDTLPLDDALNATKQLVASELCAVDQLIIHELSTQSSTIRDLTLHIIRAGGKRLRPLLLVLIAKILDYHGDTEHHELAAIIEFIHVATLLHDDVIDHSQLRRNQPTANAIWGNTTSVLAGDFLYSRAFQILARRHNIPIMQLLADTTNQIAESEVLQLSYNYNPATQIDDYYKIIGGKTAALFAASCKIGAMISTDDTAIHASFAQYGWQLGLAFQITDDVLDYTASSHSLGKNIGDDLIAGKVTLPLIYALKDANSTQKEYLLDLLTDHNAGKTPDIKANNIDNVLAILQDSHAIEKTKAQACQHHQHALNLLTSLPYNNLYLQSLVKLTEYLIQRHL